MHQLRKHLLSQVKEMAQVLESLDFIEVKPCPSLGVKVFRLCCGFKTDEVYQKAGKSITSAIVTLSC